MKSQFGSGHTASQDWNSDVKSLCFRHSGSLIKHPQGPEEARNPFIGVIYLRFCCQLIQKNFKMSHKCGFDSNPPSASWCRDKYLLLFVHTHTLPAPLPPPPLRGLGHGEVGPAATNLALPHSVTSGEWLSSRSQGPSDSCLSLQQECCGTSGPMDWVNFTSAFRAATPEVVFPWPPLCCRRTGNFIPLHEEGCRLGLTDYLFTKVCPCPAAPLFVRLSDPLWSFYLFLPPTFFSSSPLWLLSFSSFSLALSPLSPCVPPPSASQWEARGLSGLELAPATFLRLSGSKSNRNHINNTRAIVTMSAEPLRCTRHSSKCFKSLSY